MANQQLPQRKDEQRRDIRALLNQQSTQDEIRKVLPKHVTPERITRVALTAFLKTPELLDCSAESLMQALMVCAQAGLEPDGRLAHIIPYGRVAQVIFDYKGLVTLAKRNGVDVKASLVYEKDAFEYIEDDGSGKTVVHHTFDPFNNRGNIVGTYSRAVEKDKIPDYELMSIEEVEEIRKRSKAGDKGPWRTDYGEMVKKTVIRRHSKRWDLLPEIRDVIYRDDDTPSDLGNVRVSAPIFKDSHPKQVTDSQPQTTQTPPPDNTPPKGKAETNPEPVHEQVKKVRDLCAQSKLSEGSVIAFLKDIGLVDQGVQTLEEIQQKSPDGLVTLINQWTDIEGRISANQQQ